MERHQLRGTMDVKENAAVLRIRGNNAEQLLSSLREEELLAPNCQLAAPEQEASAAGVGAWLKRNIVRAAASLYMLGNVFVTAGGFNRRSQALAANDPKALGGANAEIATGLAFTAGDAVMLAFGHRSPEQQLNTVARKLGDLAASEGWELASTSPIRLAQEKNASGLQRAGNFMRENVIAFKSVAEISAGVAFTIAGWQQRNYKKAASGALIATGFALGQLIPERKPAYFREEKTRDVNHDGMWNRLRHWIEEKPMRIMGAMTLTNNALVTWGALDERKKLGGAKGPWVNNLVQAGTFAAANVLLANSSKTNAQTTDMLMDQAYAMAANVALDLPPEQRSAAITKLAECLASQPEIDATRDEALAALTQRVQQQASVLEPAKLAKIHREDYQTEHDAVPGKWRETVRRQKAEQRTHHHERS
jgi:hypothetical protein